MNIAYSGYSNILLICKVNLQAMDLPPGINSKYTQKYTEKNTHTHTYKNTHTHKHTHTNTNTNTPSSLS